MTRPPSDDILTTRCRDVFLEHFKEEKRLGLIGGELYGDEEDEWLTRAGYARPASGSGTARRMRLYQPLLDDKRSNRYKAAKALGISPLATVIEADGPIQCVGDYNMREICFFEWMNPDNKSCYIKWLSYHPVGGER